MFKILLVSVLIAIAAYFLKDTFNVASYFATIFANDQKTLKYPLFTPADLKQYNGIDKPFLYLSILGKIYDVTKGEKHYGAGKTYHFFVGRDASRSFITGDFNVDPQLENVADLSNQDLRSLNHWVEFYNKEYIRVGKLIGKYYDQSGIQTPYAKQVKKLIKRALEEKESQDLDKIKFPPCNVEWDPDSGTRVWCSTKSGGIDREWAGFPHKYYEPAAKDYRCACIHEGNKHLSSFKEYENCDKNSLSCFIKD